MREQEGGERWRGAMEESVGGLLTVDGHQLMRSVPL